MRRVESDRRIDVVDHVAHVHARHRALTIIGSMDERAAKLVSTWLDGLSLDGRRTLYSLLDEVCNGLDVSRHNPFGFLRLRAEFETSGELFGCTLPELRDAVARVARRGPSAATGRAARSNRYGTRSPPGVIRTSARRKD